MAWLHHLLLLTSDGAIYEMWFGGMEDQPDWWSEWKGWAWIWEIWIGMILDDCLALACLVVPT